MSRLVSCRRTGRRSRFATCLLPLAGNTIIADIGRGPTWANELGKASDEILKKVAGEEDKTLKIESLEDLEKVDWQSMSYPERRKVINCSLLVHASVERMREIAEKAATGLGSIQANVIRDLAASARRRKLMLYDHRQDEEREMFPKYFNEFTSLIIPGNRLLKRSERLEIIKRIADKIRTNEQAKYTEEEVAECKAYLAGEEEKRRRKAEEEERRRLEEEEKLRNLGWFTMIGRIIAHWFAVMRRRSQSAKM